MNADSNYSELEELSRRGRWLVLSTVAGSGCRARRRPNVRDGPSD